MAMTGCGSVLWMAPEILTGETYNEKVDVFSYAMVLVELISYKLPVRLFLLPLALDDSTHGDVVLAPPLGNLLFQLGHFLLVRRRKIFEGGVSISATLDYVSLHLRLMPRRQLI